MNDFDVIVIGAGVIGISLSWECAARGLRVAVVDSDSSSSSSATWASAGMLGPVTESNFGEGELLNLNLESLRRYPDFLRRLALSSGVEVPIESNGTLFVALSRDQAEALHRLCEFQQSLGLEIDALSAQATRDLEPSLHPSVQKASFVAGDRALNPRVLLDALGKGAQNEGAKILRGQAVVSVLEERGRAIGVNLAGGQVIRGSSVVVCAGCWSGSIEGIPGSVAGWIRPVKGQIIRLAPTSRSVPNLQHVVRTEDIYLVPRSTGELIVGATVEESGFDATVTAGAVFELLRSGSEAVPAIRETELVEVTAGLRPGSRDNLPMVGPTQVDGLYMANGHYRNGILLAPLTAESMADLLTTGVLPELLSVCDPNRTLSG